MNEIEFRKKINEISDDKKKLDLLFEYTTKKTLNISLVAEIAYSLKNNAMKKRMLNSYEFSDYMKAELIKTFPDDDKSEIILKNKYKLDKVYIIELLESLKGETIIKLVNDNMNFIKRINIKPFEIIRRMEEEEQLKIVKNIEKVQLKEKDKLLIIASLSKNVKEKIDKKTIPSHYLKALKVDMDIDKYYANVNINGDLEKYRDLDELISINPTKYTKEEKEKFVKLCKICPKLHVRDNLIIGGSSAKEYIRSEAWISSVIKSINPNWSDVQKLAYIDNAIGKKISYSPDCDTEIFNDSTSRSLWKIIDKGYGVCNGISQVEQYILEQVNIKSERVHSDNHSFLIIKNIELPTKDGTIIGNTIVDPTWNITAHKFGAMPLNFCVNYEEMRKKDIQENGTDSKAHYLKDLENEQTIALDEQNLRNVFKSIELTEKDGSFPIKKLIDESKKIYKENASEQALLKKQFKLLKAYKPDFTKSINSTMQILESIILDNKKLTFDKCIINRVYEKTDKKKRPVLYIFMSFPKKDAKFYYLNENKSEFVELNKRDFEDRFECYKFDLNNTKGIKPWETKEQITKGKTTTSSRKIIESQER